MFSNIGDSTEIPSWVKAKKKERDVYVLKQIFYEYIKVYSIFITLPIVTGQDEWAAFTVSVYFFVCFM
jgi:hypothetical protein